MDPHGGQYHHQQQGPYPPQPPTHQAQPQQQYPFNPSQPYQQQQPPSPTSAQRDQYQVQRPQPGPQQQSSHKPQSSHSSTTKGRSRGFSFHSSDKPRKNSVDKEHLHETTAEKEAKRLHSKADPSLAISEAEPAEIAAMSETSLAPLRAIVHKDATGNPIVDPDKSNPTRSRWERPLDTIRSFEAAVDGAYSRKSMMRTDTDPAANWQRRGSYQQGPGQLSRNRPDSFYGSRPASTMMRPDGPYDYQGQGTSRNSIYEGQGYNNGMNGGGYGYPGGRQRPNRQYQEAPNHHMHARDQQGYQLSHKDRSYETVTSAAASGGSDPAGYQTDPTSSDNSSIERRSPSKRPEPVNDYGIGFSQPSGPSNPSFTVGVASRDNHPLPPPPAESSYPAQPSAILRKEAPSVLRRQPTQQSTAAPEKRKSWFSRRFSKNN